MRIWGSPAPVIKQWLWNAYHTGELQEALDEARGNLTDESVEKVLAAQAKEEVLSKLNITKRSPRMTGKGDYVVLIEFLLSLFSHYKYYILLVMILHILFSNYHFFGILVL